MADRRSRVWYGLHSPGNGFTIFIVYHWQGTSLAAHWTSAGVHRASNAYPRSLTHTHSTRRRLKRTNPTFTFSFSSIFRLHSQLCWSYQREESSGHRMTHTVLRLSVCTLHFFSCQLLGVLPSYSVLLLCSPTLFSYSVLLFFSPILFSLALHPISSGVSCYLLLFV